MIFTRSKFLILLVVVTALPGFGQFTSTSSSDKTRNAPYLDDKGAPLDQPSTPLKIVKMKGVVENVDLDKRTITIYRGKKHGRSIELTFPQPNGLEQVKTSKKTAKILGKKRLALEDVEMGYKVRLQYYPLLNQVAELVVEKLGS